MRPASVIAASALVVVIAGVGLAFSTLGTPAHERLLRFDRQREDDLATIAARLAADPDDRQRRRSIVGPIVTDSRDGMPRDPQTHRAYEVRRRDATHDRLCATFVLPSDTTPQTVYERDATAWRHGAGRTCYDIDTNARANGGVPRRVP